MLFSQINISDFSHVTLTPFFNCSFVYKNLRLAKQCIAGDSLFWYRFHRKSLPATTYGKSTDWKKHVKADYFYLLRIRFTRFYHFKQRNSRKDFCFFTVMRNHSYKTPWFVLRLPGATFVTQAYHLFALIPKLSFLLLCFVANSQPHACAIHQLSWSGCTASSNFSEYRERLIL